MISKIKHLKHNQNIKNALYSVLDTLFLPLVMILITPLLIKYLGMEQYGMWMLINSLIVAMSILNIGGVDTAIKYISYYRGNNDIQSVNEIFSTVFVTQLFFAFVVAVVSFFLPHLMVNSGLFNISDSNKIIFEISLQFGILFFSLKLSEQVVFAYFKGFERFDISSIFSIFSKTIMMLIQLLTALNGGKLNNIFINSFIGLCILIVFEIFYIKKINKDLRFFINFKLHRIREIFHFAKWSWIISIVGTISGQIDKWLLAGLANMTILGYYSIALLVFRNIHSIIASSVGWIFPKVSKEKNEYKILKYYFILEGILLFASMFISAVLLNLDVVFLLWLKQKVYDNSIEYIHNILLLLPLYSVGIIPFFVVKGRGFIKYNFYSDVFTFIIRVVSMYLLYKIYGLNGIIIALGISGFFLIIYLSYIMKKKVFPRYNLKLTSIIMVPIVYIVLMLTSIIYLKIALFILLMYLYFDFLKMIKEY